jgi:hypothetical protein
MGGGGREEAPPHSPPHSPPATHTPPPHPAAFAPFATGRADLTLPKLIYAGLNLAGCGVFLWKLRGMGLLPLTSSDWLSMLPATTPLEHSALASPAA